MPTMVSIPVSSKSATPKVAAKKSQKQSAVAAKKSQKQSAVAAKKSQKLKITKAIGIGNTESRCEKHTDVPWLQIRFMFEPKWYRYTPFGRDSGRSSKKRGADLSAAGPSSSKMARRSTVHEQTTNGVDTTLAVSQSTSQYTDDKTHCTQYAFPAASNPTSAVAFSNNSNQIYNRQSSHAFLSNQDSVDSPFLLHSLSSLYRGRGVGSRDRQASTSTAVAAQRKAKNLICEDRSSEVAMTKPVPKELVYMKFMALTPDQFSSLCELTSSFGKDLSAMCQLLFEFPLDDDWDISQFVATDPRCHNMHKLFGKKQGSALLSKLTDTAKAIEGLNTANEPYNGLSSGFDVYELGTVADDVSDIVDLYIASAKISARRKGRKEVNPLQWWNDQKNTPYISYLCILAQKWLAVPPIACSTFNEEGDPGRLMLTTFWQRRMRIYDPSILDSSL